jgi:lipoyl(octanoyl) transferase
MIAARRIPFEVGVGPWLMAADDLLLAHAVEGRPTLRFYGWAEPTLSLGYFQPYADRLTHPRLGELAVVRRSTGGGAIVHHHELTYAIGIPAGLAGGEPWGCRMHHLIADVLKPMGVVADPVVCGEEVKRDPFLCFEHHTAGDLAIGPRGDGRTKVIGSAQRKRHGAIIQHGSILLRTSEFAPRLPGIAERSGFVLEPRNLANAIVDEFAKREHWQFTVRDWSEDELTAIEQIRTETYANPEWTQKR